MNLQPVYFIKEEGPLLFPHPFSADENGLLAIGGDLRLERLILAYRFGIFPWYSSGQPILWWAPRERFVLDPDQIHITKSMRKYLKRPIFRFTTDQHFEYVIARCQNIHRPHQDGTWITPALKKAYIGLHHRGIAHSVEIWQENEIVGGLYGVGMGRIFSGESMFSEVSDASKYAAIVLAEILREKNYLLIDAQHHSPHIERLGGYTLSNFQYFKYLKNNLPIPIDPALWPYRTPFWKPIHR